MAPNLLAPALQPLVAFLAKPSVALDFPASMPVLPSGSDPVPKDDNSNGGGSVRRIDMAANLLAPAVTVPAVALGDLAFALRLTPNRSEILNARQAVNPAAPLIGTNSASGLSPQPAQTSTAGLEKSISNQAHDLIAAPTASYATVARGERTSEPRPVSSPASTPKITENATAWPWLRTQASTENLAWAPRPDPGLNSGSQLESEPGLTSEPQSNSEPQAKSEPQLEADSSEVAANGSEYDSERAYRLEGAQIHSVRPDIHSSSPSTNPAGGSQESQPEPTEYKTGLAVKQEFSGFRLTGSRLEGSANVPAASAWPSEAAGAPDMPANSEPAGDGPATIVPSESEIKAAVAPAINRQISLNLSTDDSTQVNIGLTMRAGQVLVAVRTPDHELAQSLQTNLGDLIGRLDNRGFKTDTLIPAVARPDVAPLQPSNSNTSFNQPQSGTWHGSGQQRQGQNNSNRRQKAHWATQLRETISTDEARSQS
jgi:hypothetical protein